MRIHFFTDYFRPEPPPPAHHIAERARIWAAAGHDVTVITNHPNYPEGKIYSGYSNQLSRLESRDGFEVLRVWTYVAHHKAKVGKLVDHASFCLSSIVQALRLPRPDVVVATSPHLFSGLAGAWYSRLRRCPFVLEVRDLWPDSVLPPKSLAYGAMKRIERHIYRAADAVSVLTPAFEKHVIDEGARRAVTIVGGADLRRFTPGKAPAKLRTELGLTDAFVVGYPGTLGTAHDTPLLLDAAERLKDSRVRFLLIGGGPFMRDIEQQAARRCPGMIVFVPTQPPEAMPDWWRAMDAGLVLLNKTKAMQTVIPSKMFECMATRKPVIFVGPRGAGSDVISSSGGGIVVDSEGPQQLETELRSLAGDETRYELLASHALRASAAYSRERQAEQTLDLFREVSQAGTS